MSSCPGWGRPLVNVAPPLALALASLMVPILSDGTDQSINQCRVSKAASTCQTQFQRSCLVLFYSPVIHCTASPVSSRLATVIAASSESEREPELETSTVAMRVRGGLYTSMWRTPSLIRILLILLSIACLVPLFPVLHPSPTLPLLDLVNTLGDYVPNLSGTGAPDLTSVRVAVFEQTPFHDGGSGGSGQARLFRRFRSRDEMRRPSA